ncbi:MAG TPA: hypothetical protein QF641_04435, partial [Candidatus Thalassarchaeaceae archaeon]|nr:hypothetical protein [Candidatus Thalassarchaeaceae archaeon]
MASEADEGANRGDLPDSEGAQLATIERLSRDFDELSEKAQQLLTEKLFLENEYAQLKKRANRLDEELRNIRNPPLVIGYLQGAVVAGDAVFSDIAAPGMWPAL